MYKKVTTILFTFSLVLFFFVPFSFAKEYPKHYGDTPSFDTVNEWYSSSKESLKGIDYDLIKDEPGYLVSYYDTLYGEYKYVFFKDRPTFKFDYVDEVYRYSGDKYYMGNSINGINGKFGDQFGGKNVQPNSLSVFKLDWGSHNVTVNGQEDINGGSPTPGGGNGNNQGFNPSGILDKLGSLIDSIRGGISSIIAAITNIAKTIIEGIRGLLVEFLKLLLDGLKDLLKSLFVPSDDFLQEKFNGLKSNLGSKFGTDEVNSFFGSLSSAQPKGFSDIVFKGQKVVDMTFINSALPNIKVYTDGLFWFLLICYQIDNVYLMIRGKRLFNSLIKKE
jgi:hypothetical protein